MIILQCVISFQQLEVFQVLQKNERNIKIELFTSFQVRVLLAFLAPSTAFWYSPRCTNVDASRAKLEMLLKRIFAASYIFCSKHLSPTCPIFAWFGLEINSSRSARRPVWAKAKINSVSINVSFAFFLAICKNLTRSSRFPKTCFQWSQQWIQQRSTLMQKTAHENKSYSFNLKSSFHIPIVRISYIYVLNRQNHTKYQVTCFTTNLTHYSNS